MGRLSSGQGTAAGDRSCRRIQSESEPRELTASPVGQLSASLERSFNNTWENMVSQGSDDLQETMNNDSQEIEVKNTELFKTGNLSVSTPGGTGRVDWDGTFSTVTTLPDPTKTQGRVLHPEQPR